MVGTLPLFAETAPAGGAAIWQVIVATIGVSGVLGAVALLTFRYRAGGETVLARAATAAGRVSGLPGWAALPTGIVTGSLLTALFGFYWDVSLHIDKGRDEGPLANPAHYLILVGLIGVLVAGWLAVALPRGERPGPAAVRLAPDWYAPVGGILITLCGGFALLGFPLDDLWHRAFGQDVTLWGPTHMMMLGGAAMTLAGQAVLLAEAAAARKKESTHSSTAFFLRRVAVAGGLLIGLSIFQGEFDFGVPQFRLILHPMLVAAAGGLALVFARVWGGPGTALGAVVMFLVVRGIVSLFTGPLMGETTPAIPLYVVEALVIELAGLALARRPLALGVVGGLLAGSAGLGAAWAWSRIAMPLPWNNDLLPEALLLTPAAGLAGGLLGALMGTGLRGTLPRPAVARAIFAGSLVALIGLFAIGLPTTVPSGASATVRIADTAPEPKREGQLSVRFSPPALADDAAWANVTAWQGGEELALSDLERAPDGGWRTSEPVPLHPDWKALVRVHRGREMAAVPIYLPADTAIPAPETPAEPSFTRPFVEDADILQRERDEGVAGWLWPAAAGTVLALYLGFLTAIAWGVGRVGRRLVR